MTPEDDISYDTYAPPDLPDHTALPPDDSTPSSHPPSPKLEVNILGENSHQIDITVHP